MHGFPSKGSFEEFADDVRGLCVWCALVFTNTNDYLIFFVVVVSLFRFFFISNGNLEALNAIYLYRIGDDKRRISLNI